MEQFFGQYNAWKTDEHTWFITTGGGSMYMYLIEGDSHALLIDTGYGFGNLRAFVEGLTQKPIIVANTHGHLDHAGGNGWWDEVYMHPEAHIDNLTIEGGPFDISTLPHPEYKRNYISEGFVFDLGGRTVETIELGGHAVSSLAFLDSRGYLFCGDELESAQVLLIDYYGQARTPKERAVDHLAGMNKLKERLERLTAICPAHNGSPISAEYIFDFIELDQLIIENKHTASEQLDHFYIQQRADADTLRRTRYKGASFIYKI